MTFADGTAMKSWWMKTARAGGLIEKNDDVREIINSCSPLWDAYQDIKARRGVHVLSPVEKAHELVAFVNETHKHGEKIELDLARFSDGTTMMSWWKISKKAGGLIEKNDDVREIINSCSPLWDAYQDIKARRDVNVLSPVEKARELVAFVEETAEHLPAN